MKLKIIKFALISSISLCINTFGSTITKVTESNFEKKLKELQASINEVNHKHAIGLKEIKKLTEEQENQFIKKNAIRNIKNREYITKIDASRVTTAIIERNEIKNILKNFDYKRVLPNKELKLLERVQGSLKKIEINFLKEPNKNKREKNEFKKMNKLIHRFLNLPHESNDFIENEYDDYYGTYYDYYGTYQENQNDNYQENFFMNLYIKIKSWFQ